MLFCIILNAHFSFKMSLTFQYYWVEIDILICLAAAAGKSCSFCPFCQWMKVKFVDGKLNGFSRHKVGSAQRSTQEWGSEGYKRGVPTKIFKNLLIERQLTTKLVYPPFIFFTRSWTPLLRIFGKISHSLPLDFNSCSSMEGQQHMLHSIVSEDINFRFEKEKKLEKVNYINFRFPNCQRRYGHHAELNKYFRDCDNHDFAENQQKTIYLHLSKGVVQPQSYKYELSGRCYFNIDHFTLLLAIYLYYWWSTLFCF